MYVHANNVLQFYSLGNSEHYDNNNHCMNPPGKVCGKIHEHEKMANEHPNI